MLRVRLTSVAEAELADALAWYSLHAPGETGRFLDELEALLARLEDNPFQFPAVAGEARRAGFRRYPYGLFFVVRADEVWVFACFHASRSPRRWRDRL